jgi:hypothetical protein
VKATHPQQQFLNIIAHHGTAFRAQLLTIPTLQSRMQKYYCIATKKKQLIRAEPTKKVNFR